MFAERGDAGGDLPETVQGIIAARLDSLPPEEKELLLDAAVLGKTFWRGALDGDDVEASPALAAAEGVHPSRAPQLGRGRERVRVRASARPRRRVRAAPARRARGEARARGAVDRVARRRPRRGSRGAARAPLPRGARARRGVRRRDVGARRSRARRAADGRAARAGSLRVLAGRALRDARSRAVPDDDARRADALFDARAGRGGARQAGSSRAGGRRRPRRSLHSATSSRRRGRRRSPRPGCGTSASATRRTRRRSARSRWCRTRPLSSVKPDALSAHARLLMLSGEYGEAVDRRHCRSRGREGARRGRDRGEPADHPRHGS